MSTRTHKHPRSPSGLLPSSTAAGLETGRQPGWPQPCSPERQPGQGGRLRPGRGPATCFLSGRWQQRGRKVGPTKKALPEKWGLWRLSQLPQRASRSSLTSSSRACPDLHRSSCPQSGLKLCGFPPPALTLSVSLAPPGWRERQSPCSRCPQEGLGPRAGRVCLGTRSRPWRGRAGRLGTFLLFGPPPDFRGHRPSLDR